MSTAPSRRLSVDEYLTIEERAEFRSEFYQGEMFAMAGTSWRHNQLVQNIGSSLRALRGGPCQSATIDIRVYIQATGLFTYPDVLVVCGQREKFRDREDTVLNPKVIFEVLSDSTEVYDRGEKFRQYQLLPSLTDYVLVSQHQMQVEHFSRANNQHWLLANYNRPEESLRLASIGHELKLAEIYADIDLDPGERRLRTATEEDVE